MYMRIFIFTIILYVTFNNIQATVWIKVQVNKNSPIDAPNPSVYISVFSILSSST